MSLYQAASARPGADLRDPVAFALPCLMLDTLRCDTDDFRRMMPITDAMREIRDASMELLSPELQLFKRGFAHVKFPGDPDHFATLRNAGK